MLKKTDKTGVKPVFSIIIPVYNVDLYLENCFESLCKQNLQDAQVIIVDDGSTDTSSLICEKFLKRFENSVFIRQNNQGVAAARNMGLRHAEGDYILWVDPDDEVLDDWIESIRCKIREKIPDLLFFDYEIKRRSNIEEFRYGSTEGKIEKGEFIAELQKDVKINSVLWNKVIKRKYFDENSFKTDLQSMEDYDILTKISIKMENIIYLPKTLYSYRIRGNGLRLDNNFEAGYQGFQLSLERITKFREAGFEKQILGVIQQAKSVCCRYYLDENKAINKQKYTECKEYIRKNQNYIWNTMDLSWKEKMKIIMAASTCMGLFYKISKNVFNSCKFSEREVT